METRCLNINVGILGHIDSGKTSLVKALSTSLSTAALDKNPQSQQRGITLDLGFSSFTLPLPDHLNKIISDTNTESYDSLQFTLVDCPGHASLIKTIIGGAQIIDMVILVVDANKGVQTQTAECIVIAEITTDNLIVVLNKVDTIPADAYASKIDKVRRRITKIFSSTKFADAPIVETAAAVGGEKVASVGAMSKLNSEKLKCIGVDKLILLIQSYVRIPKRNTTGPFYYAIDHCFAIKGHGTVLTGTVLSGSININDTIEIPHLQVLKKVKSMQMFRKSVKYGKQGDRIGICVTNLDPKSIERAIASSPGTISCFNNAICLVKKIRFFKQACKTESKFHITVGHTTVIAVASFFGASELGALLSNEESATYVDFGRSDTKESNLTTSNSFPRIEYCWDMDYQFQDYMVPSQAAALDKEPVQWVVLRFQQPVYCPLGSLVIGSRLDADAQEGGSFENQCRLAFYGPIKESLTEASIPSIRIYNWKVKNATVFKTIDIRNGLCFELIAYGLVNESGSIAPFIGMKIGYEIAAGINRYGTIVGPFGAGGKFKVKFVDGVRLSPGAGNLFLKYKRFINDKTKLMNQTGSGFEELPCDYSTSVAITHDTDSKVVESGNRTNCIIKIDKEILVNSIDTQSCKKQDCTALSVNVSQTDIKPVEHTVSPEFSPGIKIDDLTGLRIGKIESVKSFESGEPAVCIVSNAFKMEENIRQYIGAKVALASDGSIIGALLGPFAKLGKCKVLMSSALDVDKINMGDSVIIIT